jgi:hypothetical protein
MLVIERKRTAADELSLLTYPFHESSGFVLSDSGRETSVLDTWEA